MSTSYHSTSASPTSAWKKFITLGPVDGSTLTSIGLFILRAFTLLLFLHGLHKAQGFGGFVGSMSEMPIGSAAPQLFGILVVAGQLLLGFGLFLGLGTRWCGFFLALMFAFIIAVVNIPFNGLIDPEVGGVTFESSLFYFVPGLVLMFAGPGRFSFDYLLGRK